MHAPDHDHKTAPDAVELPAPTPWPMVTALGITLLAAGVVTHVAVSAVGALLSLAGAVGWWRDVLPEERVVVVPFRPAELQARPVAVSARTVEYLHAGEGGHRMRIPVEAPPYWAGILGGVAGAVAMAVVAVAYGLLIQGSVWYPINLLAGLALTDIDMESLDRLRAFNLTALVVGVIVHGILSIMAGLLYAVILPTLPSRHTLWGGLVAPLLWTGVVWAVLGVVNPALERGIDWPWFIASQIVFGLAAGFFVSRCHPVATTQTWPLAARVGLEAAGLERRERRRPS